MRTIYIKIYSVSLECATKKWLVFDPNEKRITVHFYFSPKVADLEKLYGEKITKNQMIKILRVGTFNPHQNDQGQKGPCYFQRLNALKCLKCQKI